MSVTNHLEHVSYNCRLLAQSLQFSPSFTEEISESFIDTIAVASRLHDIGNIQAPCNMLLGTGTWGPEEMKAVKRHVEQGAEILERVYASTPENSFLPMAIEIARYHHARWDGKGYPQNAVGKEIPLSARITIILDIYDTLMGERSYKRAYSKEESLKIIEEGVGIFFDPEIADVFFKVQKQLHYMEG